MKKILFALLLMFLVAFSVNAAVEERPNTTKAPTTATDAPKEFVDIAEQHIIKQVGLEHFNEYVDFIDSKEGKGGTYQIWFSYKIPFKENLGSSAKYIRVFVASNKQITEYKGPKRAYNFTIDVDEALRITIEEGISFPTEAQVILTEKDISVDNGKTIPEERYMWKVWTDRPKAGEPTVIYIDFESGEIIGVISATGDHVIKGREKPQEVINKEDKKDNEGSSNESGDSVNIFVRIWRWFLSWFS